MAIELNLDSLKDMKKADFVKAFKNKPAWKKANAVIILVDYKLDGKKATVAIPFKKIAEMKMEMKRLKKEKLHLLKKSGGASFEIEKNPDGPIANIELLNGGLAPQAMGTKVADLFAIIKLGIKTSQSAEAAAEAAELPAEKDPDENLPEDNYNDVETDEEDEAEDKNETSIADNAQKETVKQALMPEEKAKMMGNMKKMEENLNKLITKLNDLKSK